MAYDEVEDEVAEEELMKHFNITKKYFKDVYAYIYCSICKEILSVRIDKEAIRSGLQTGLYIYKYTHNNPDYDEDDPDDLSYQDHTCSIYIDSNYEVRGVQTYFGTEPSSEDLKKGTKIPIVVKDIPAMSVNLGMLSPKEYKILQLCDGNNSVEVVADIAGIGMDEFQTMIEKLEQKGLVNMVIRG